MSAGCPANNMDDGDSSESREHERHDLDPTVDFIAGTIAGVAGLAVGHPFDTVKVRFQSPETSARYKSIFNAFATIMREENLRGLYKGLVSPMVWCAPLNGLVFASYGFFMRLQARGVADAGQSIYEPSIGQIALAGIGSGIVASSLTCPIELIKIRQQNIVASQPTARSVALDIVRRCGWRGLYRGITATAMRDCGYGAYFASYEATCRFFRVRSNSHPTPPTPGATVDHASLIAEVEAERDTLSWPALLAAGAIAGVNGWLATFAFDVVKTRVQSVDYQPSLQGYELAHPYQTTMSTIAHSYRNDGTGVFFRGLSPTLIRAIPVNMAMFAVFETVVRVLA